MPNQEFHAIRVDSEDSIYTITLNSPPLNIIDVAMIDELQTALRQAEANPETQVILFRSEGKRAFSAGVSVRDHTPERVHDLIPRFDDVFRCLGKTQKVTVGAVQGFCLGGGFELAIMCDLVIATDTAQFGQPEIKLGQLAPVGVILLPHLVGYRKAAELLFTGLTINAREAEALGLVNRVVTENELDRAVADLLRQLTDQSKSVLRLTKVLLRRVAGWDFDAALRESERFFFESVMKTEDSKEGIFAFLEKRPPQWIHR